MKKDIYYSHSPFYRMFVLLFIFNIISDKELRLYYENIKINKDLNHDNIKIKINTVNDWNSC